MCFIISWLIHLYLLGLNHIKIYIAASSNIITITTNGVIVKTFLKIII